MLWRESCPFGRITQSRPRSTAFPAFPARRCCALQRWAEWTVCYLALLPASAPLPSPPLPSPRMFLDDLLRMRFPLGMFHSRNMLSLEACS